MKKIIILRGKTAMKRILAVLSTILCLSLVTQAGAWEQRVFKKGMRPNDRATSITALTDSGITVYDKDGNAITWFKDNNYTIFYGRVGIGTATPLYNLEVIGSIKGTTTLTLDSIAWIAGSVNSASIQPYTAGQPVYVKNYTGTILGTFVNGGNFGIGTGTDTLSNGAKTLEFGSGTTPTTFPNVGFVALVVSGVSEMFGFDRGGTFTQLTSHDPITGEFYRNEFNIYTGLGKKTYDSGTVVNYTVDKLNPEEEYKKVWITEYQNTGPDTEVDLTEALTDEDVFFDGEIVSGETEYTIDPAVPAIKGIWKLKKEKVTLFKIGTKKALKADHRLDAKTGKIYRTPSLEEAQAAAETGFKFDWNRMPKFIRDAWGH